MAESPRPGTEICIRCGYDLAGLGRDGLCPECALPVAESLERSPLLRGADLEWLSGVESGLRAVDRAMTVLVGLLIGMIALVAVGIVLDAVGWSAAMPIPEAVAPVVMGGAVIAAAGLHLYGCWRAVAPTPAEYGAPVRLRWAVRWCGVGLVVSAGMTMPGANAMLPLPRAGAIAVDLTLQANALAFFFGLAALLEHYESRTRGWSPELAKKHRNVRKNLIGCIVLVALFDWAAGKGGRGDWGVFFFGVVYMFMDSMVRRVRTAVGAELRIAEHRGGRGTSATLRPDEDADAAAAGIGGAG